MRFDVFIGFSAVLQAKPVWARPASASKARVCSRPSAAAGVRQVWPSGEPAPTSEQIDPIPRSLQFVLYGRQRPVSGQMYVHSEFMVVDRSLHAIC
jgi:hypothetical protein